jgi:hypothetical protein
MSQSQSVSLRRETTDNSFGEHYYDNDVPTIAQFRIFGSFKRIFLVQLVHVEGAEGQARSAS